MEADRMGGLSEAERTRYARQLMIPGWGEATQERLRGSTVFIAGAGGLGSPVAFNLAGVGSLLKGRLLCCDYLEMRFFEVKVKKDPCCPACGSGISPGA